MDKCELFSLCNILQVLVVNDSILSFATFIFYIANILKAMSIALSILLVRLGRFG